MTRLTRDDIVVASGKRFATYGYHGTSMRDLGDDLGILGSSIYAHVGGKHELLVAVVERASDLFSASAAAAIALGGDPDDTLKALVAGHIDVLVDHAAEAKTFLNEAWFLEESDRLHVIQIRNDYEAVFRRTIQLGVDDGTFRRGVDVEVASIYILSILNAIERWFRPNGRLDRAELATDMHRFIVEGLT
ncbi:MAG: TetR/AcrR family transcriptional regulator [Actinomycetota bacterium]|nr:TetR/AcrR family transcriptional regulator [Actinomycetota bacterium]